MSSTPIGGSLAIAESRVRWFQQHTFSRPGYRGYCYPILHPDHVHGSHGRYQLLAVWQPHPGLPPACRSFYYPEIAVLARHLRTAEFMDSSGFWLPIPNSPEFLKWPDLLRPHLIGRDIMVPRIVAQDVEEADKLQPVVHRVGGIGEGKPAAVIIEE